MVRRYTEEEKKRWNTIEPYLVPGVGFKLREDAPPEVVEARDKWIEREREIQIEYYGFSTI